MSVLIDIMNYETYVVDFLEGNLNEEMEAAFRAFLLANPAIAEEIEELEAFEALTPIGSTSFDASSLKIEITASGEINETNYEEHLALWSNAPAETAERQHVEAFVAANPALAQDAALYKAALLKPDTAVVFAEKGSLKQPIPLWWRNPTVMRAAASVAVLMMGYFYVGTLSDEVYTPRDTRGDWDEISAFERTKAEPQQQVAEEENPTVAYATATPVVTPTAPAVSRTPISTMSRQTAQLAANIIESSIEAREVVAYQPDIRGWEEAQPASDNNELNLSQFVGKQWLDIEPDKAERPAGLIKEGIAKLVNRNENVNLANIESDQKNTVHLLAGNFEFKRVNYK